MKNYHFKTNINCGSCVAKVSPVLDATEGINTWSVDTSSKDKVLRVETAAFSEKEVIASVEKAGYRATPL